MNLPNLISCWRGVVAGLLGLAAAADAAPKVVSRDDVAPCVQSAIHELEEALAPLGDTPGTASVIVESLAQPALNAERTAVAVVVPAPAESFAIHRSGTVVHVIGRDAVGAMYGVFELAERARATGSLATIGDVVQQPFLEIRAVNQFLFEQALQDPHSWFFQDEFWNGYFSLLARTRHNVLDLHAGFDLVRTSFPNIYPYFVFLDEFPGQSVGREAAARNLAMLNRIIALGAAHGVKVALMNYTVQGRSGIENSAMLGELDAAALERYTYLASRALLRGCPDLWMYGFRIGESGQPEDFFAKTYLRALADTGFRGRLYTRSWLATRDNIETIRRSFPGEFYIEVKYNGERLGLPYQAITSPTRFDPSYSYEGYTSLPRPFRLLYQVRANGTHRIFHWGDPGFVARVVRSCRLGDAAGYSVEPMTAYYPMIDRYHPATGHRYFRYTWQRDWFWYTLWGRLGYDPSLPEASFARLFEERFGPGGAALEHALARASQIVPAIDSTITLGPDHRQWAPEVETGNPNFSSVNGLRTYGTLEAAIPVPSLDPTVMSSVTETAAAEVADTFDGRVDPRTTAGALLALGDEIEQALARVPAGLRHPAEAECIRQDVSALVSLARFAGERYLALLCLAEYKLTSYPGLLTGARHHLLWAREHWRRLADTADSHYAPLLESLRMQSAAYRWASQLPVIDGDLAYLGGMERSWDLREPSPGLPSLTHLPGRTGELHPFAPADAAWPVQWRESAFSRTTVGGRPALRSEGGRLAFDFDDLLLDTTDADVAIEIPYWNPGDGRTGLIAVSYDAAGRNPGALAPAGTIEFGGGAPGWRTARFELPHARFANTGPGNSDLVLAAVAPGTAEFIVQSPALRILRPPAPHLDLHVTGALDHAPKRATIHWRRAGGEWAVAPLRRGIGTREMNAFPRGREVYRFDIPAGAGDFDYFFEVEWPKRKDRLPAGERTFVHHARTELDPPVVKPVEFSALPRREGPLTLAARVTDPSGVARVQLFFKPIPSQKNWASVEMTADPDGRFTATVPLTPEGLLYRFAAWDRQGNAVRFPDFRVETPYLVIPAWNPAAP